MRLILRLAVVAVMCVIVSCASRDEHASAVPARDTVAADSGGALVPIDGQGLLALAHSGSRVTLVNVWATWCDPCRQEMPELLDVTRAHRADGVRLVLVSTDFDEQRADVHRFLTSHAVRDTTYLKQGGDQAFIDTMNRDWTGSIPATFVYDSIGNRVAFWEGRADRARFEAAIRRALGTATSHKEKTS